jgi:hypothetical protein
MAPGMAPKDLRFRYGEAYVDGARGLRWGLPVFMGGLLLVVIGQAAAGAILLAGIVSGILAPTTYAVTSRVSGQIVIGRRFVVVGQDIFYYRNLSQVKVDAAKQTLALFKGSFPVCVIKAEAFPTNARKDDKIAKNRRAKFAKVESKLLARILQAAPDMTVIRLEGPAPA